MTMSFGEHKGLWLGILAVLVAVVALIWLLVSGGPSTLVILFPEVGELKKGDPVLWRDYTVGSVEKIEPLVNNQIGVTIRIRNDYTAKITRGTKFTLKQASIFGWLGQNAIVLETPAETGLPYLDGERVQGESPPRPTLVEQGKQQAQEYWQQLKDQAASLLEEYQKSPYRKEVENALAELKNLAEKGAGQAEDELAQFRKDHQKELDSVLQKLEQARDWIRKKGDELGARKIQEEIDKLKK
jgi:ABC-type transporter Mla subunit MlaD